MHLETVTLHKRTMLDAAVKASKHAGRFLMGRFGCDHRIHSNEKHDVKLDEDVKAEEIIRICLSDTSAFEFLGEESYEKGQTERYVWVVDPLDGTANYARGIPHFSTSIALLEEGVPVLGVVRNHASGEMFTAISGKGAFCNGVPVHVSSTDSLDKCMLSGGFMKTPEMVQRNLDFINIAVRNTFKLRITGSAALDLCEVARGRFDIYSEKGIMLWDIAAGLLIASEAGAAISLKRISDAAFDATALTPGVREEFRRSFPDAAPFGAEINDLLENN